MDDPVLIKLKTDAGIVLADLWRTLWHQPPAEAEEWRHPRVDQSRREQEPAEGANAGPKPSGLCYFHLN
jgi:hypothetical protein